MPPSDELFDPTKGSPPPCKEPVFGTYYWCQDLSKSQIEHWDRNAQPQLPPSESMLSLPPQNHFIPTNFLLKDLPPSDCYHPLLNCSIKLQISVGKRKVQYSLDVRFSDIDDQLLITPFLNTAMVPCDSDSVQQCDQQDTVVLRG